MSAIEAAQREADHESERGLESNQPALTAQHRSLSGMGHQKMAEADSVKLLAFCFIYHFHSMESGAQRGDRTPDQLGVNEPLYR